MDPSVIESGAAFEGSTVRYLVQDTRATLAAAIDKPTAVLASDGSWVPAVAVSVESGHGADRMRVVLFLDWETRRLIGWRNEVLLGATVNDYHVARARPEVAGMEALVVGFQVATGSGERPTLAGMPLSDKDGVLTAAFAVSEFVPATGKTNTRTRQVEVELDGDSVFPARVRHSLWGDLKRLSVEHGSKGLVKPDAPVGRVFQPSMDRISWDGQAAPEGVPSRLSFPLRTALDAFLDENADAKEFVQRDSAWRLCRAVYDRYTEAGLDTFVWHLELCSRKNGNVLAGSVTYHPQLELREIHNTRLNKDPARVPAEMLPREIVPIDALLLSLVSEEHLGEAEIGFTFEETVMPRFSRFSVDARLANETIQGIRFDRGGPSYYVEAPTALLLRSVG